MKMDGKWGALALSIGLVLGSPHTAGAQQDVEAVPTLSEQNKLLVTSEIQAEVQRFVNAQKRIDGQGSTILARVNPDPSRQWIYVDLDSSFLPKDRTEMGEDLGQLVREIQNHVVDLLTGIVEFKAVVIRVDGKRLDEIYPPRYKSKKAARANAQLTTPVDGLVVLSPSHGRYFHYGSNQWEYQRPLYVNSTVVHEDTITPSYTSMLQSLLTSRSPTHATSIRQTRDIGNTAIDPNSGLKWAELAARYYLARLYPNETGMWNQYPNGKPNRFNLREYDDDIAVRSNFANFVNAETMISIHTDGSDTNPSARGLSVFTNLNDPKSVALAESVKCYVQEQIKQRPDYPTFPIRSGPNDGVGYGEVREADMETVLVEVGFHTNAEDAALLQTTEFRTISMRGIEKGYRMYREGKACAPFAITSVGPAAGKAPGKVPVSFSYVGYPQGTMKADVEIVKCAPGNTCYGAKGLPVTLSDGKLSWNFTCGTVVGNPTHTVLTKLYDADGVFAKSVESAVTCQV